MVGGGPHLTEQYFCSFSNPLHSLTCSFDGEEPVECSFPVTLSIDESVPGPRSAVVTATDEFGQTFSIPLGARRKQVYFLPAFLL